MTILKQGSKGPVVTELQNLHYAAGQHIDRDGIYGPTTERAVHNFQQQNGLGVDGIAGPKTMDMLQKVTGKPTTTVNTAGTTTTPGAMKTSAAGLDLIKGFESYSATAYLCPAKVLTIGYGHTGSDVKPGMRITVQRGMELLAQDVNRFERAVNRLVTVPLTQGQFDALVSFAFNVGEGAGGLQTSTLLKKLNARDYAGAAAQFNLWNKSKGKVLAGLVRRRAAERKMFEGKP